MSGAPRPDPTDRADTQFWAALRNGALCIQQCASCGAVRHPPAPFCARCGETRHEWRPVAGTGEVWSFTVIHPPTLPAFADRTPYNAVVVRLDEGVFVVSNLVECPIAELAVGAPVELVLTPVVAGPDADDDLILPLFRRTESALRVSR
ncbi:MAG TPA: Zn-ribbon domain-containing OB-fold protein [Acidimicrobiia bacterium]|nr:Zn-ribbon domain-containing OB-fold protein [Acidimicrobiia bacterium]